jgi:hypothetical protein
MFKIEYDPDYSTICYKIYRKEFKFFGLNYDWVRIASFESLDKAEAAVKELLKYPKYYE